MTSDPAGGKEFQSCPGAGQGMEAAVQDEVGGHADHSSSGSAGYNHPALVVRRLTSRQEHKKTGQDKQ